MVKQLITSLVLLLLFSAQLQAKVTATVDKNPVIEGESFILEVVADEDMDTNAFDSSPLLQDFIVGRTSVSSQTSMINFKTSYTTRWQTVLIARSAGVYIIPSFNLKGQKTDPIKLTVVKANDKSAQSSKDIFIETQVSAQDVYVQQQVTLQVKLYIGAELRRASLSEPTLDNANIIQIGKDVETVEIVNGRRFRVIERVYAINPQQSGDFVIKSPMFSGEVLKTTTRRPNFFGFDETKPVSVLGKEIPLKVRPIPETFKGQWLPSELLALHEEWQPNTKKFKVGEPITRTITLTAAGLSEEQLPKIAIEVPEGLKVYPDQAELHTSVRNNKLISQKVKNFAIVASRAGRFTLPKVVIPWWNTVTDRYEEAILPEQTIIVEENKDFVSSPAIPENTAPEQKNSCENTTVTQVVTQTSWLQWLFLGLWLATASAWLLSTLIKTRKKAPTITHNNTTNQNDYMNLVHACQKNNGQQVLKAIVPWVNSLSLSSKNITTLDEAIDLLNDKDFTQEIEKLQQCYYAKEHQAWESDKLLNIIKKLNQQKNSTNNEFELKLNP